MCNWGWLTGPVGGLIVGNEQKKRKKAQQQAKLANQEMQKKLAEQETENSKKIDDINEAINTNPIVSTDSLTNNSANSIKPKRTISTLSLASQNSGLNVR